MQEPVENHKSNDLTARCRWRDANADTLVRPTICICILALQQGPRSNSQAGGVLGVWGFEVAVCTDCACKVTDSDIDFVCSKAGKWDWVLTHVAEPTIDSKSLGFPYSLIPGHAHSRTNAIAYREEKLYPKPIELIIKCNVHRNLKCLIIEKESNICFYNNLVVSPLSRQYIQSIDVSQMITTQYFHLCVDFAHLF